MRSHTRRAVWEVRWRKRRRRSARAAAVWSRGDKVVEVEEMDMEAVALAAEVALTAGGGLEGTAW